MENFPRKNGPKHFFKNGIQNLHRKSAKICCRKYAIFSKQKHVKFFGRREKRSKKRFFLRFFNMVKKKLRKNLDF